MPHMDEGRIRSFLDGELADTDRQTAAAHLEECSACAHSVEEQRTASLAFTDAMEWLDRPAHVDYAFNRIMRRLEHRRPAAAILRAAVLVLAFGAAASAAIPGTPLHEWANAMAAQLSRTWGPDRAPADVHASSPAGVSILPKGRSIRIMIEGTIPGARVRVRLVDGRRVGVSVRPSGDATFETGPEHIRVEGAGGGGVIVRIPRLLTEAAVLVDGRTFLRKRGNELFLSVVPEDSTRPEILFEVSRRGETGS